MVIQVPDINPLGDDLPDDDNQIVAQKTVDHEQK
jgi:hypothetical protein